MKQVIPQAALAQHIAILGKTGSGKTYAAKGIVEGILEDAGRVCIIDPTGAWHGLRSSSTGKSAGFPVVIFGGSHADLPLGPGHGEAIAEIIGTSSTPAIIDTSLMRVGERTQFFTDFADAIVRKNKGPLQLVIDEAHLFAPQGRVNDPRSGAMLHAANNLVSLGRSRGLRIILITQRPAKLHKDSLTQVETLVAMRLIAPQDRNAVEEWIKDNADAKQGREIISSLATLKTGQGWIWAPELDVLERVTFPRISTFDTSRAPDGESGPSTVLAPIDREAIAEKLKAVGADALANDPAALKRRIAELQRQVAKPAAPALSDKEIDARTEHAFESGRITGYGEGMAALAEFHQSQAVHLDDVAKTLRGFCLTTKPPRPEPTSQREKAVIVPPTIVRLARSHNGDDGLSAAARKILAVLAQYEHEGCTAGRLALLTGYSYSGGFRNSLSELRTANYLEGGNTETMRITRAGLALGPFEPLPTGEALRQHWLNLPHFGAAAKKILGELLEAPRGMSAEQLATATGYEYSGGFRNALSELRTAGVLVGKNTGVMTASEELLG